MQFFCVNILINVKVINTISNFAHKMVDNAQLIIICKFDFTCNSLHI